MDPMRILAKPDDRIQSDPVNGTSLQLCFLDLFHMLPPSLYLTMYGHTEVYRPEKRLLQTDSLRTDLNFSYVHKQ